MNNLIQKAKCLPIDKALQTISVAPITFEVPERPVPMELRVTAPLTGNKIPVILFSHGGGPSLYTTSRDGYNPLVNFLAEHGFAVIQTSHQSSKVGGFTVASPTDPIVWKSRAKDLSAMIDHLDEIEDTVPTLKGRLDKDNIAAVGHSFGAHTVSMILGSRLSDLKDSSIQNVSLKDSRVKTGVLLGTPGLATGLSDWARENMPFLNPDFSHMTAPALVMNGELDHIPFINSKGPSWHTDAYHSSLGSKALLTTIGGKHGFGGIAGYDAKETDDEDPDRLETVRRMTWAYLRTTLGLDDKTWAAACKALREEGSELAIVQEK